MHIAKFEYSAFILSFILFSSKICKLLYQEFHSAQTITVWRVEVLLLHIAFTVVMLFVYLYFTTKHHFHILNIPRNIVKNDIIAKLKKLGMIENNIVHRGAQIIRIFCDKNIRMFLYEERNAQDKYQAAMFYHAQYTGIKKLCNTLGCTDASMSSFRMPRFLVFLSGFVFFFIYGSLSDSSMIINFAETLHIIVSQGTIIAAIIAAMLLACCLYVNDRFFRLSNLSGISDIIESKEVRISKVDFLGPEFLHKLHRRGINLISGHDGEYFFNSVRDCSVHKVVCDVARIATTHDGVDGCFDENNCENAHLGEAKIKNKADNVHRANNDEIEAAHAESTDRKILVRIVGSRSFIRRFNYAIS